MCTIKQHSVLWVSIFLDEIGIHHPSDRPRLQPCDAEEDVHIIICY